MSKPGISPSIKRWDTAYKTIAIQSDTASLLNQVRGKSGVSESHITDTPSPGLSLEGREKETEPINYIGVIHCHCYLCKSLKVVGK